MINLYNEFHALTNPTILTNENQIKIKELTSIKEDFPIAFLGLLSNIVNNEPQYYFNRGVSKEVSNNLTHFYKQDSKLFLQTLISVQDVFFDSIKSYFHILDLFKELDSVAFENELKIKLYYLPVIQQLMEYCLNFFYAGINKIINEFVNADFSKANTLGQYKNNLTAKKLGEYTFDKLTRINIDLRNSISHGKVDFSDDKLIYSYTENRSRRTLYKELKIHELDNIKNELFDIAGGAIIGWIKFITNNELFESIFKDNQTEDIIFQYFKFYFQNDNVRINSISNSITGSPQLNIQIKIENIYEKKSIIHLIILLLKAMYQFFPKYDRYFISYKHPFSVTGMISLNKEVIDDILDITDIAKIDKVISTGQALFLVPDIYNFDSNIKAYKFQVFPKIKNETWEIVNINDISVDNIKRYKCNLIIDNSDITKDEIITILFSVSKRIRQLENKRSPYTKIKYGKVEADVVNINVFYRQYTRKPLALLSSNENFICSVYYYKSHSSHRINVPFHKNYIFEKIKKLDLYWNKNWKQLT